jgi:hypothetical protein
MRFLQSLAQKAAYAARSAAMQRFVEKHPFGFVSTVPAME